MIQVSESDRDLIAEYTGVKFWIAVDCTSVKIWLSSGCACVGLWVVLWSTKVNKMTCWCVMSAVMALTLMTMSKSSPTNLVSGRHILFIQVSRIHWLKFYSLIMYALASAAWWQAVEKWVMILQVSKFDWLLTLRRSKSGWLFTAQVSHSEWFLYADCTNVEFWVAAGFTSVKLWLDSGCTSVGR